MSRIHAFLTNSFGIKHDLGNPPSIPDIYEYQSPEVSMTLDPAANGYILPYIGIAELAAGMCSEICSEYIIAALFQLDPQVLRRP